MLSFCEPGFSDESVISGLWGRSMSSCGHLAGEMMNMDPALAKEVATLAQLRAVNEAIEKGDSEIQRFYAGATIFITGGSGFVGKQLIEKLLRSCDIKKVFLLMRPKKKRAFHERLDYITKDPVFDILRKTKPDFMDKFHPVQGDVSLPKLGISDVDWNLIVNEVDIIIHGAATIKFDEHIRIAALTNVRGTVEMLALGRCCKKLRSFVHISTAYSHATVSRINKDVVEDFYEAPLPPRVMIDMAETISDERLQDITPNLIRNWPNTYTFTKAIAEQAVREMEKELPICIVRPAIVICSYREPSPGWLDLSCAFGPSGFIVGGGLGLVHTLLAVPDIKIDLVPVDLVNNAVIAAGWATAKRRAEGERNAKIYTVTNLRNYIKWSILTESFKNHVQTKYATPKAVYYNFVMDTQYRFLYILLMWLWHYIPAYLIDCGLWIAGKKQMAVKLYTKAAKLNDVLSYFTTNEWKSSDKNLQGLLAGMSATDQLIYNFDVAVIDWKEQVVIWAIGIRKYILKDNLQGTEYGNKKQKWLRIVHYLITALYFFLLWKVITLSISFSSYVYSTTVSRLY